MKKILILLIITLISIPSGYSQEKLVLTYKDSAAFLPLKKKYRLREGRKIAYQLKSEATKHKAGIAEILPSKIVTRKGDTVSFAELGYISFRTWRNIATTVIGAPILAVGIVGTAVGIISLGMFISSGNAMFFAGWIFVPLGLSIGGPGGVMTFDWKTTFDTNFWELKRVEYQ